jgi:Flp pilus assembly protein TadG
MVAGLALALVLMLGVARLGHAASDKARAETAADAAALAAAGVLARGGDVGSADAAAADAAARNDARLDACSCGGRMPTVTVSLGAATVRARAEVRFECLADPDGC